MIENRLSYVVGKLLGIQQDSILVFYGAQYNWWAGFAFWMFKRFGHADCRVMDGGHEKWIEEGRLLSADKHDFPDSKYRFTPANEKLYRTNADEVIDHIKEGKVLLDVRTDEEIHRQTVFIPSKHKEMFHPNNGHIPTAINIQWQKALNPDGTYKSADELQDLYQLSGVHRDEEVMVYCSVEKLGLC